MTRLSEALKRAAAESTPAQPAAIEQLPSVPAELRGPLDDAEWKFAPVETMHVPDEPPATPAELQDGSSVAEPVPATTRQAKPIRHMAATWRFQPL